MLVHSRTLQASSERHVAAVGTACNGPKQHHRPCPLSRARPSEHPPCSCARWLTELDVPVLGEEHIARLQVTVDDLFAVEVMEGFQHLAANHLNLGFGQAPVQLCGERSSR